MNGSSSIANTNSVYVQQPVVIPTITSVSANPSSPVVDQQITFTAYTSSTASQVSLKFQDSDSFHAMSSSDGTTWTYTRPEGLQAGTKTFYLYVNGSNSIANTSSVYVQQPVVIPTITGVSANPSSPVENQAVAFNAQTSSNANQVTLKFEDSPNLHAMYSNDGGKNWIYNRSEGLQAGNKTFYFYVNGSSSIANTSTIYVQPTATSTTTNPILTLEGSGKVLYVNPNTPITLSFKATGDVATINVDWNGNQTDDIVDSKAIVPNSIVSFTNNGFPSQKDQYVVNWSTTAYSSNPSITSNMIQGSFVIAGEAERYTGNETKPENHTGQNECHPTDVDPIDIATGAQIFTLNLLSVSGLRPIDFIASYNSLVLSSGSMGLGWGHNYETYLQQLSDGNIKISWRANREDFYDLQADGSYLPTKKEIAYNPLTKNADGTFLLTLKNKTQYLFNTNGHVIKEVNPQGQKLVYSYNKQGYIAKITEPVSDVYLRFHYNANFRLIAVSDPLNRRVEFSYDPSGRIIAYKNALKKKTTYTLDDKGQLVSGINADGIEFFHNTYDEHDRVIYQKSGREFDEDLHSINYDDDVGNSTYAVVATNRLGKERTFVYQDGYLVKEVIDELGNKTQLEYDDKANPIKITDAKGRVAEQTFDSNGNVTSIKNPLGDSVFMTYDENDNLLSRTDAKGNKTSFTYDDKHNVLTKTDAKGKVTKFSYTNEGKLKTVTSPMGYVTTYSYQKGRLSKVEDAQSYATKFAYDDAGRLTSATNADGFTTTLTLDNLNRVIETSNPLGQKVKRTYDSRGNVLTTTDANSNVSRFEYDGNDNLIKSTNAAGFSTHYFYDKNDRLIRVTDPKGSNSTITYDAKGRIIKTTDALGNTVVSKYDKTDQLVKKLDPLGQETLYNYNAADNLVRVTNALNQTTHLGYDKNSNIVAATDALGRKTLSRYDALNRLIESTDALSGKAHQNYDADGKLTAVKDPNANKTTFKHNARGLVTKEITASGSTQQYGYNRRGLVNKIINGRGQSKDIIFDQAGRVSVTTDPVSQTNFIYDANSNLLRLTDTNGSISRSYDELNRVSSYTNVAKEKIQYKYDRNSNLTTLIYPDNKVVNYEYDANNRLIKVIDWAKRTTRYEYDAKSRLIKTTRPNGSIETKKYNAIDQLTEQQDLTPNNKLIYQVNYEYDAVGNITKETVLPDSEIRLPIPKQLSYTKDNRVNSFTTPSNNVKTFDFDADNNMIKATFKGVASTLDFNARNQLVSFLGTTYRYDAEGNRVQQTVNGVETRYTINPEAVLSQALVAYQGNTKTYYVYGLGLIGQETNGDYRSYHYDYRGSTVALSNSAGALTDRFSYTPFGDLSSRTGSTPTPFKYDGRDGVMSDNNGLYYMRARYYSPELHRFVNQDTLLGDVASSSSLNRFGYVSGNPLSIIDPLGLEDKSLVEDVTSNFITDYLDEAMGTSAQACNNGDKASCVTLAVGSETKVLWHFVEGLQLCKGLVKQGVKNILKEETKKTIKSAAEKLGNLSKLSRKEADEVLKNSGFEYKGKTPGGYDKYYHPDGSRVQIRPDGEIVRTAPKVQNSDPNKSGYRPRIDSDGELTEEHNTGEYVK